MQFQSW